MAEKENGIAGLTGAAEYGTAEDLDVQAVRRDFPLLACTDLAYLDSSATSQKPACVLDKEREFYEQYNANPFRGLYDISEKSTEEYEAARSTVAEFIHAQDPAEIIFTRNTTESLNLLGYSLTSVLVRPGDQILISMEEHHSNMLPWRLAAKRIGATIAYVTPDENGEITAEAVRAALTPRTRIAAITQMSNVFGKLNDMKAIAAVCHENGTVIVADGAQSVPHVPVDVQDLDVDFLAFSGHKMLGPMAIGVLYGKTEYLEKMPPFLSGGEMIDIVTADRIVFTELPHRFEAGTVNAPGAIALAEAIRYLQKLGFARTQKREHALTARAIEGMKKIPGVRILGSQRAEDHHGIIAFTVDGVHPHDISEIFSADRIAVRAGHHCAQPLHLWLKVPSSTRASPMFYNTEEEVDRFLETLGSVRKRMGYGE